jgi:hypothetical protein
MSIVVFLNFIPKLQMKQAAELRVKSPLLPPFSKEEFSRKNLNPSLKKHALSTVEGRGRGDFEICGSP